MSPIVAPGQVTYPGGGGRALVPADELRAMVWFVGGLSPFGSSGAQRPIDSVDQVEPGSRPRPPGITRCAGCCWCHWPTRSRCPCARCPNTSRQPRRCTATAGRPGGHHHGARFPADQGVPEPDGKGHRRDRRRGRRALADAGDHGAHPRVWPLTNVSRSVRHHGEKPDAVALLAEAAETRPLPQQPSPPGPGRDPEIPRRGTPRVRPPAVPPFRPSGSDPAGRYQSGGRSGCGHRGRAPAARI